MSLKGQRLCVWLETDKLLLETLSVIGSRLLVSIDLMAFLQGLLRATFAKTSRRTDKLNALSRNFSLFWPALSAIEPVSGLCALRNGSILSDGRRILADCRRAGRKTAFLENNFVWKSPPLAACSNQERNSLKLALDGCGGRIRTYAPPNSRAGPQVSYTLTRTVPKFGNLRITRGISRRGVNPARLRRKRCSVTRRKRSQIGTFGKVGPAHKRDED